MRIGSLVFALLLLSLFVPAAGAIYIPGQEIPDDGQFHILSAGEGTTTPAGVSQPAEVPPISGLPGLMIGSSNSLFSQGFPGQVAGSIQPSMPGTMPCPMPSISLPPADSEGNIVMGGTIGHIVSPPTPGYWDNLQDMDLHTNMPVINVPAFRGL